MCGSTDTGARNGSRSTVTASAKQSYRHLDGAPASPTAVQQLQGCHGTATGSPEQDAFDELSVTKLPIDAYSFRIATIIRQFVDSLEDASYFRTEQDLLQSVSLIFKVIGAQSLRIISIFTTSLHACWPERLHPWQVCCATCLDDEKLGTLAEATTMVSSPARS